MSRQLLCGLLLSLLTATLALAEDPSASVPVPVTRWSLKEALEAHRSVLPRLPPALSDAEKARGRSAGGQNHMRHLLDPEVRALWPSDWLACNLPLEEVVPFPTLNTDQVIATLGQHDWILVDARDSNSFNGWALDGEAKGGHLPGAVNVALTWVEKDMPETKALLARKGITGGIKKLAIYGKDMAQAARLAKLLAEKHGVESKRLHVSGIDYPTWSGRDGYPVEQVPNFDRLVPPAALEKERKSRPELRIYEVSWGDGDEYAKGHIPGAVHINTDLFETPPIWDLVPIAQLEKALLSLGITRDTPVVLYGPDPLPSFFAAAVMLHVGVADVRILNGGFPEWQDAGLPVEKGRILPRPATDFGTRADRKDIFVGIAEAKMLLAEPNKLLVDVRSWKEFIGEIPGYDDITACGRIPGAVWGLGGSNASSMEDYRNPDGTMRDHRDIAAAWKDRGITPDKTMGFYCGTGWRASETYMAARLMDWPNIMVYDGGWYEWSADPRNPTIKGDPAMTSWWWPTAGYVLLGLLVVGAVVGWLRRGRAS